MTNLTTWNEKLSSKARKREPNITKNNRNTNVHALYTTIRLALSIQTESSGIVVTKSHISINKTDKLIHRAPAFVVVGIVLAMYGNRVAWIAWCLYEMSELNASSLRCTQTNGWSNKTQRNKNKPIQRREWRREKMSFIRLCFVGRKLFPM